MQVESLNDTEWDIVIAGTGLHQSLLALALSRSSKKILHVDKNSYYGGAEAAFSLQEAEEWIADESENFHRFSHIENPSPTGGDGPKLASPRAYSLALAPQLIYTQAKLIQCLVSSRAFRQLEFQAMGSWWLYSKPDSTTASETNGALLRIPTNREDIAFSDTSIDLRSKRTVMKVLRFVVEYENHSELWEPFKDKPFVLFLQDHFKLSPPLVDLFLSLAMSPHSVQATTTIFALPRIARHLRSIGRLGPGFSSVIPKWGGLSEIAQVGCRAGAVGGAVYVLHKNITKVESSGDSTTIYLSSGDKVRTKWLVGSAPDMPSSRLTASASVSSRAVSIVASKLQSLFPARTEGAPPPAGAVVIYPAGSLQIEGLNADAYVHLIIHSSDTGECPKDQSVIYASTSLPAPDGPKLLDAAVSTLLALTKEETVASVLWRMHYQFQSSNGETAQKTGDDKTLLFPSTMSADMVFDDQVLDEVESVWRIVSKVNSEAYSEAFDGAQFLVFDDREGQEDEDDDEGYA